MPQSPGHRRVPAEWEAQACVWIAWPHNRETWPGSFESIPAFFARWIASIAESTPVRVLVADQQAPQCEAAIGRLANVTLVDIPTNDCWIRDYGPTFVRNDLSGTMYGVKWKYNAWGGKYPPWNLDDAAARLICNDQGIECVDSQLCLEGGAIETDGAGRLITTPGCLLTDARNPGWTRSRIEDELQLWLGVHEIVWLSGGGLAGDDTDGHIDQLARFIDPQNIVTAVCDDSSDENHAALDANYRQLRHWAETANPPVTVHRLPIPPQRQVNGQRVPESYCNFLRLGPSRLQMPVFNVTSDDHAARLLRELSGVDVEPIDCRDLVWGLGALHCASRDQPAV